MASTNPVNITAATLGNTITSAGTQWLMNGNLTSAFTTPDPDPKREKAAEELLNAGEPSEEDTEQLIRELYDSIGIIQPKEIVWLNSPHKMKKLLQEGWHPAWKHSAKELTHSMSIGARGPKERLLVDATNPAPEAATVSGILTQATITNSYYQLLGQPQAPADQEIHCLRHGINWMTIGPFKDSHLEELRQILIKLAPRITSFLFTRDTVYLLRRPVHIKADGRDRLHSIEDMAVKWPNGTGSYHIEGVSFTKELWSKIVNDQLDTKEALGIADIDQRSIAIKHLGPDKMIKALKAKKVSKGHARHYKWDGRIIQRMTDRLARMSADITIQNLLYETKYFRSGKKYFLYYHDPSTGQPYISFVTQGVRACGKDADAVMAWKHHMTKEDYLQMVAEA